MAASEQTAQHPDPANLSAEDTDFGCVMLDRPMVRDVSMHYGDGRVIVLVTFKGWSMPNGFAADYRMQLVDAYAYDPRPLWKRILNIGPPCRLVGHFVRDREHIQPSMGGAGGE
jgi:hypothetical protein